MGFTPVTKERCRGGNEGMKRKGREETPSQAKQSGRIETDGCRRVPLLLPCLAINEIRVVINEGSHYHPSSKQRGLPASPGIIKGKANFFFLTAEPCNTKPLATSCDPFARPSSRDHITTPWQVDGYTTLTDVYYGTTTKPSTEKPGEIQWPGGGGMVATHYASALIPNTRVLMHSILGSTVPCGYRYRLRKSPHRKLDAGQ
ncbi:hypothetical protein BaRGS_00001982 [Batillaria attramentaria]|uniref:Uncharacterized protein n=1 Tax=Batillaria attramentaria TaxID=370345 RepID=A0ABD0M482_9CAEN